MTKIGSHIAYLQAFAAPLRAPGMDAMGKPALVAFLNEAIQEAAKIVIEAREIWTMTEWTFDIVANQKVYPFYSAIAPPGSLLKDAVNFARAHSLFVANQEGKSWVPYAIIDKRKALMMADPADSKPFPRVYIESRVGHGGGTGTEGDMALIMENPPNYNYTAGGRFSVYVLPRALAPDESDDWQPFLPPIADTYVRRYALRLAYLAAGKNEQYDKMGEEMVTVELRLRAALGSGLSDDPQHVFWEQSNEEFGN